MIRTFLSDVEHHALCRLLERAGVPETTRTEVLIAAEEAASTAAMLELLKQRRVTPIVGLDGALRWYPTDSARAETAERAAAHAILTNERRASIHAGCSAAKTETSSSSEGVLNSTRAEQPAPLLRVGTAVIIHAPHCHATVPTADRPDGGCVCGARDFIVPRCDVALGGFDSGIYCADDERCILDRGHDGDHVYEVGATL